jgi:hypothetical protein
MTFNTETGDVELDAAHRAVELVGVPWVLQGPKRNVWTTEEKPPDGAVAVVGLFIELTATRNPGTNTSSFREFDLQFLYRFEPGQKNQAAAKKLMNELCDALHRSGEFTGEDSAGTYGEVLAIDGPVFLDNRYFAFNVTLKRAG